MPRPIMKYNPAFLSPAELIDQFVVRHDDLQAVLRTVRENSGGANQHVLVIGPRGSGKTMLVRRVAAEINRDPQLGKGWYPLVFSEESYEVTTPGEFWLEALFHLGQQTKDPRWQAKYEDFGAKWQDEPALRERALGQLLGFADEQGKRLLLIVENLNGLLGEQLSHDDAWVLRHTLQNEPRIMLLATATSRFEEIDRGDRAMYELFHVHDLRPLDRDECRVLWHTLTGQFLEGDRVRPIHIITGGNLRLLTILSTFAAGLSLREFMGDLVGLVDEHTGYFKSHLDALPPTERKVYLALAEIWDPATAREVADVARLGVSAASSLLKRLVERGAVATLPGVKRTKRYQIAERMYNIYYLFRRRGSPAERVRAVVRFMISYYEPEQLVAVAGRIADEALTLESSARQDHYQVLCDLVDGMRPPTVREKLVNVARDHFAALDDVPAALAEIIRSDRAAGVPSSLHRRTAGESEKVFSLLKELSVCLNEHRIGEAERLCRQVLELNPQSATAWMAVGLCLSKDSTRQHEAAISLRKAIEIDPRCAEAWALLGTLLHHRLGRFDEAESAYRKAVEIDPSLAIIWAHLGQLLDEKLSKYDDSERAYRMAIEVDPQPDVASSVWRHLGRLLHNKLLRFDEAEKAYRAAIEIAPRDAWTWAQLGWLLHGELSRFDEAEQAYRRAVEIDPLYSLAWTRLGQLLHRHLSRFDEAEAAYRKAIAINANDAFEWVGLGWVLHDGLLRFAEAEEAYRKAIAIDPNSALPWHLLGVLMHIAYGRLDEAEQAYRRAIEIDPENLGGAIGLFDILLRRRERRGEAVQFAEAATGRLRGNCALLHGIARRLFEDGETALLERARQFAREAIALAPDNGNYQHTLASIECALNNREEAFKWAQKYLSGAETIKNTPDDATDLFVELSARGEGERGLKVLLESPSYEHLEPLIVGLRLFLGEEVNVAQEVKEIGMDIARRIEQRRDALAAAPDKDATTAPALEHAVDKT